MASWRRGFFTQRIARGWVDVLGGVNKTRSKKEIAKTICNSVNHTHLLKEDHLPDCARRDKQGKKGDRVDHGSNLCHGSKRLRNSALHCRRQHFIGTICFHILPRSWRPPVSSQNWYMSTQLQSITVSLYSVVIPLGFDKNWGTLCSCYRAS